MADVPREVNLELRQGAWECLVVPWRLVDLRQSYEPKGRYRLQRHHQSRRVSRVGCFGCSEPVQSVVVQGRVMKWRVQYL